MLPWALLSTQLYSKYAHNAEQRLKGVRVKNDSSAGTAGATLTTARSVTKNKAYSLAQQRLLIISRGFGVQNRSNDSTACVWEELECDSIYLFFLT